MQRSTVTIVLRPNIHAFVFEKIERYWLVSLSCNMQYVNSVVVSDLHVRSIV